MYTQSHIYRNDRLHIFDRALLLELIIKKKFNDV